MKSIKDYKFIIIMGILTAIITFIVLETSSCSNKSIKVEEIAIEKVTDMGFINLEIVTKDNQNIILRDKESDVLYLISVLNTPQRYLTVFFTPIAKPNGFLTYEEWRSKNEQKEWIKNCL